MALPNNNITAGAPPLLWSNVKEALDKINDNFTALDLATGGTAVDLSILNTDVSPEYTGSYTLGSTTNRWKSGYFNVWGSSPSESVNGLWIGGAQIRGIPGVSGDPNIPGNSVIDLPLNSTIGGSLIIDPLKTFFKEIEVDNGKRVVATEYGSLLTLTSGYGIALSVTSASDEITFEFDQHVDIIGNVLAADEITVLVDSATGKLKADVGVTVDWNIDVDGNTWTFDTSGILTFPGTSGSQATFGNDILQSVNDLNVQSEASVYINTDSAGAQPSWEFGSDGILTAPGSIQLNYLGTPTYSLSASTAGGRIVGEEDKTFKIILNNGISQPEWTFGTDGNLTIPATGNLVGNVSGNILGSLGIFTTSLSVGSSSQAVLYTITNDVYVANTNADSKLGLRVRSGPTQITALEIDPLTSSINILNSYTLVGPLIGNTTGYHTGDVKGSIFGNDLSTMLVDGTGGRIVGDVYTSTLRTSETTIALGNNAGNTSQGGDAVAVGAGAGETGQGSIAVAIGRNAGETGQGSAGVAIGYYAGKTTQETGAVAIGYTTAQVTQRQGAVAIGWSAGQTNQGANAIAIGYRAGFTNQNASSIVLNASGTALNAAAAGFFVSPVRNQTGASGVVQYDSTTSEISFSSALGSVSGTFTGNIFTTLIDSADSSAITVTPAVIFSANINIENDIQLSNIDAAIRGTNKIKFVPSNADELSYNVRLDVYSESTIEPRLALDTPDGVDLTLSSGMAGIVISKINGRVNLAAGNNAFIVKENGSWAMTPLNAAPLTPTVGMYIADCATWDPASKANGRPYPVWYDGVAYNALY
jgi:hypothetical protein